METLNMIADDIAYKLGNPYDAMFKESIRRTVKHWRVTLLRQSMVREKRIFEDYLTSVTFELERVDLVDALGVEICCGLIAPELDEESEFIAYKVIGDVPKIIRNPVNTRDGFNFVGNVLRTERFLFTQLHQIQRERSLPLNSQRTYYVHINNDYYVIPNSPDKTYCDIVFEGVLEDPEEYCTDCGDTFPNDRPFKIPMDILTIIKDSIVQGRYPLLNVENREVEVKPEANPVQRGPRPPQQQQQQQEVPDDNN